jgi:hypothetical protein
MDLREIGYNCVYGIRLINYRDNLWAFVNTIMNFYVQ